jgi:Holliday junction resolvasome RuvABC endonuclease subunit
MKTALALEAAKKLIEIHEPDVVVLEDVWALGSRRGPRLRRLQSLITNHAEGQSLELHHLSRVQIRACFKATGAATRYEIAQAIAAHIHAFERRLPPPRQIWEAEDKRMSLFDAAALALTFYSQERNEFARFEKHAA